MKHKTCCPEPITTRIPRRLLREAFNIGVETLQRILGLSAR